MNLKQIIIFGGLGLALAGGAFVFLGGEPSVEVGDEAEEAHQAPEHEKPKAGGHEKPKAGGHGAAAEQEGGELVVAKQTHVVNMPGAKSGFLRCQFSFMVRDADLGKQLTTPDTPEETEAKSIVLVILQALSAEELNEQDAREALRMDIMDRLNDRFGGSPASDKTQPPRHREPIKDVFITEWAVQR
jgi:flagellar basal body-associated protein FliL